MNRQQDVLARSYRQVLQQTMFTNRVRVRPTTMKKIAAEEAGALQSFCQKRNVNLPRQRGEELCQTGLGLETILALGSATRQFCLTHIPETMRAEAVQMVEAYHTGLMQGFLEAQQRITLEEQEQIRRALQRMVNHYADNMALASEVAAIATATMDIGQIVQQSLELIHQRLDLCETAIFLTDTHQQRAILRAGKGNRVAELITQGHAVPLDEQTAIGRSILRRRPELLLRDDQIAAALPMFSVSNIHSAIVLPLLSGGEGIGTLLLQSDRREAFSDQDVVVLRVMADQLANAILNARLFEKTQLSLQEMERLQQQQLADSWSQPAMQSLAYHYDRQADSFTPAGDLWFPEMEQAIHRRDAVFLADEDSPLPRSALALPIRLRGQVIGVVDLYHPDPSHTWTEEDITMAQNITAQAGLWLENARLLQATQTALTETEVLYRATREIAKAQTIEELVRGAAQIAPSMNLDTCSITLITEENAEGVPTKGDFYALKIVNGEFTPVKRIENIPIWAPETAHKALQESQSAIIYPDMQDPDTPLPEGLLKELKRHGFRGGILVGLRGREHPRAFGFLNYNSYRPLTSLSERNLRQIDSVADQVTTALERHHLIDRLQAALAEVEATQRRYTVQAWETYRRKRRILRHEHIREDIPPAALEVLPADIPLPAQTRPLVLGSGANGDGDGSAIQTGAGVLAPLTLRNEIIGVLGLQAADEKRAWLPEELALIEAIAAEFAQVAEEIRLLDETQQRAAREARINEIAQKIQAAQSLEEALKVAATEVGRSLQAPQTVVQLQPGD
ncbi:MAG: GAF domain-containing protein [Caldilineae bacterium]|nr:MAG: GAF domain-containing protein [Caldilineae bacterium]